MQKNNGQPSFSSLAIERRKIKNRFFNQMNLLLDWETLDKELKKHYSKGVSVAGRPSYSALLLFKMTLLQTWYGLSDYEVEERVKDSLSFMSFTGLSLEDDVPDHSVISRFRAALVEKGAYDKLLALINDQLEARGILLRTGAIVDASITDSPRRPRGKKEYEMVEDRKESPAAGAAEAPLPEDSAAPVPIPPAPTVLVQKIQGHVDTEAAWVKKGGKLRYGYKKHIATDEQGLVTVVLTTAANESDTVHLAGVIARAGLKKGARVKADKGYCSESNRACLKEAGLRDGIMHKAKKNKPLSIHQARFNRLVSRTRYRVERTLGGMVRWFGGGRARYVGKAKTHGQHVLEGIAYNLYRSPGIVASNPDLWQQNQLRMS